MRRLMEEHGFSGLLILHGNALLVGGRVVLLLGPAGIGKSTASRRLVRLGAATLIEDGLVVVGEEPGTWQVVETGTLGVLHRAARIAALLRNSHHVEMVTVDYPVTHFKRFDSLQLPQVFIVPFGYLPTRL